MIEADPIGWINQTLNETGQWGLVYLIALLSIIIFKVYRKRFKPRKKD